VVTDSWMRLRKPVIYQLVVAYADHPEWLPIEDEREGEPGEDKLRTRTQSRTV
jgi:hypothetical protein